MSESEQTFPKPARGGRVLPWRRDPLIMARLREVERRHFAREPNTKIAAALNVDEATIRNDLKRLKEIWLERVQEDQVAIRARVVEELADIQARAIAAAEFDQMCERAVLFNDLDDDGDETESAADERPRRRTVYRDDKGSASFRGQKAQALQVARQATMDIAKILGVDVTKISPTDAEGNTLPLEELMARYARAHDSEANSSA